MPYFAINSMVWCTLMVCSSFLHSIEAVISLPDSVFPMAEMGLKLNFDLAANSPVEYSEQCFPFFPNTPFQGGTVQIKEYSSEQELSQSTEISESEDDDKYATFDFFFTIRFHSTESDSPSCLQVGSYTHSHHESEQSAVGGDCTVVMATDWDWERVTASEGDSLLHTLNSKDILDTLAIGGNPRTEEWDICVGSRSRSSNSGNGSGRGSGSGSGRGSDSDSGSGSGRDSDSGSGRGDLEQPTATRAVRGLITLFQQKEAAPTSITVARGERGKREQAADNKLLAAQASRLHLSSETPHGPHQSPQSGLSLQRSSEALIHGDRLGKSVFPSSIDSSVASAHIYVNNLVDAAANASLCDSSLDPASATEEGQCSLRSAVATCEALLQTSSTALCSVHLPALASCRITMQPELGEIYVQGNAPMNGTLSILGNDCLLTPNASAASSVRFLNINGSESTSFSFHVSNMTLSHFGSTLLDGGAIYVQDMFSDTSLSFENVDFVANIGRHGGAVHLHQSMHVTLSSCFFHLNQALNGGGLFLNRANVNMTLTACVFKMNNVSGSTGGGLHIESENHNMTLSFCSFSQNYSPNSGGAIYVMNNNEALTFTSCILTNNAANQGAGIYFNRDNIYITLSSCHFIENIASDGAGAGVYSNQANSYMNVVSCSFIANSALAYSEGGGVFLNTDNIHVTLTLCRFELNTAFYGAGLFLRTLNDDFTIVSCSFNNHTARLGGAIYADFYNENMTLTFSNFTANTAESGAGLFINYNNLNATLTSCSFANNFASQNGGAVHLNSELNDRMTFISCIFTDNYALNVGGGIFLEERNDDMTLTSCLFLRNVARDGGGVFLFSSNVGTVFTFCSFAENKAEGDGGGVALESFNDDTIFISCIFTQNTATQGAGLFLSHANDGNIIISCNFWGNTALLGGGALYLSTSNDNTTLTSCSFEMNIASQKDGGAMFLYSDNHHMSITFCTWTNNTALDGNGGAVALALANSHVSFISSNFTGNAVASGGYGGGLYLQQENEDIALMSCTLVGNSAYQGGALYFRTANDYVTLASSTFTENIATHSGGSCYLLEQNAFVIISACSFTGNYAVTGQGGAVYLDSGNDFLTITSCRFQDNSALSDSGGGLAVHSGNDMLVVVACQFINNWVMNNGGGMYIHSVNDRLNVTSSDFTGNTCQLYGGGLHVNSDNDDMSFRSCMFLGNSAQLHGGGIYVGSNNWDLQLDNMTFMDNVADRDGGALSLVFDNFRMTLTNSMFSNNSAGDLGGAFHSALQSNNMKLSRVEFVNNWAGLYGGSIYLGEIHASVLISEVSVRGSSANRGGGLYLNHFCSDLQISSCEIFANDAADVGGGLFSFVEGLTIRASSFHNNVAMTSHGGMFIENAFDFVVLENSSVSRNVAGSSGGMWISNSVNINIESCEFVENEAQGGSGGAFSVAQSQAILVRNTSFMRNIAAAMGGAVSVNSFSTQILFLDTMWHDNRAGGSGGALYLTDSTQVKVNVSVFSRNNVRAGSGSAIFARATILSTSFNNFSGNVASTGGGTVFWEQASGMQEPAGLQTGGNLFDGTNTAGYGSSWATEAHHLRLLDDKEQFSIVDYEAFAPPVTVKLEDVYDQTVATDSTSFVTVDIPLSQSNSCDDEPGFVSGTTTITFVNGTAYFSALEPLCAPNHSLGLSVTAQSTSVTSEAVFQFDFRACVQGEYFEERICNPCEGGTYSFTDPQELPLSELEKTSVCQPCPPQAYSCYKNTMTLKQGYWRSNNDSTNIYECPWDAESCLGGESGGDASCGSGYHGPLCAVCEDDHHFVQSSQKCEPCDDTLSFFDPFALTVLALVFVGVSVAMYLIKKIVRGEKVISLDNFFALFLFRLNIYDEETYTKEKGEVFQRTYMMRQRVIKSCVVYITFYQIVSSLPFILADVDFPDVYDKLMSAVSVVNLAIDQDSIVTCSSGSQYDYVAKLVVTTTYPIVIVLLLGLCSRVHVWYAFRGDSTSNQQVSEQGNIFLKYKKAMLVLSFLILPSVSVTIFQTFSCHDVGAQGEKEEYMTADYSVSCASERYLFAVYWAGAMIFVYPLGIPMIYLSILYTSKDKIRSKDFMTGVVHMLCQDYMVKYWYWEVVDTMYRVSVTGFLVLFQSTKDTIVAGMLLSLIYLKLIQLLQPFTDPGLNRIKETSIWQIFFVFLVALLLKTNAVHSDFLTICLLLVFFGNFILLLGQYLVKWLQHVCVFLGCGIGKHSSDDKNELDLNVQQEVEVEMGERPTQTHICSPFHAKPDQ